MISKDLATCLCAIQANEHSIISIAKNEASMQDSDFLHNFHTHTMRCKHAAGDVDDYCDMAMKMGMKTLGFSDHSALPDDRWIQARMFFGELPEYIDAIDRAKQAYPKLRIVQGMECEYLPEHRNWYKEELLGKYGFEYLVGAAHFFISEGKYVGTYSGMKSTSDLSKFADYTIEMMATGYFDFIAHPDLFGVGYAEWDEHTKACARAIGEAAADLGVGLEINALGLRKQARKAADSPYPLYPWLPFWEEVSQFDVEVIINADAHQPQELQARTADAFGIAKKLNLKLMDVHQIGVS
jgi:histidinol-phosphatase (PHP family)